MKVEDVRSDSEPEPETGSEGDESPKATKAQQLHANGNGVVPAIANGVGAGDPAASVKKLHSKTNGHVANGGVLCGADGGVTALPVPTPLPPTTNGLVHHQLVSNGVPHVNV